MSAKVVPGIVTNSNVLAKHSQSKDSKNPLGLKKHKDTEKLFFNQGFFGKSRNSIKTEAIDNLKATFFNGDQNVRVLKLLLNAITYVQKTMNVLEADQLLNGPTGFEENEAIKFIEDYNGIEFTYHEYNNLKDLLQVICSHKHMNWKGWSSCSCFGDSAVDDNDVCTTVNFTGSAEKFVKELQNKIKELESPSISKQNSNTDKAKKESIANDPSSAKQKDKKGDKVKQEGDFSQQIRRDFSGVVLPNPFSKDSSIDPSSEAVERSRSKASVDPARKSDTQAHAQLAPTTNNKAHAIEEKESANGDESQPLSKRSSVKVRRTSKEKKSSVNSNKDTTTGATSMRNLRVNPIKIYRRSVEAPYTEVVHKTYKDVTELLRDFGLIGKNDELDITNDSFTLEQIGQAERTSKFGVDLSSAEKKTIADALRNGDIIKIK